MARRLLKRKLKIVNLKKLKTIQRAFTSLSQWALKQLSKKQKISFALPCPTTKGLVMHRKQLLSQLVGGFSLLGQKTQLPNILYADKDKPVDKFITLKEDKESKKLYGKQPDKLSLTELSQDAAHKVSQKSLIPLKSFSPQPSNERKVACFNFRKPFNANSWPTYALSCKTNLRKEKTFTSNWKSIYSLDQLMCHQYDSQKQFAKQESKLKKTLIENQKLTALYGKMPKKQLTKWLQKAKNAKNRSYHMAQFFESRLDVALKRCFVFNTLRNAQHWINQGRILVNHKVISSSSHVLHPGDILAIDKAHKKRYKDQILNLFYKTPKESKYIQSGRLLSRWREWARLYNNLSLHHDLPLEKKAKKVRTTAALGGPLGAKLSLSQAGASGKSNKPKNFSQDFFQLNRPLPDLAIQNFWYSCGRAYLKWPYKTTYASDFKARLPSFCRGENNLLYWLRKQRWLKIRLNKSHQRFSLTPRFRNWKVIYRRRILVFSRWLLSASPLVRDGLYFLRWHRAFIRKKSTWIKASHRQCTLQKGLHFEVSYKKLCAIYLYPPQRIVLPCMIDFRKVY